MRRAFTLIELLVVISIIAVMAAMLLPVTSTARALAARTVCASNQRQVMMATIAYVGDNNGLTPPGDAMAMGDGQGRYPYLRLMAQGYMPDTYVISQWMWLSAELRFPNPFQCPSVPPPTPNVNLAYGQVSWIDCAGIGRPQISPLGDGSWVFKNLFSDVPFLAETVDSWTGVAGVRWQNQSVTIPWTTVIRLAHRGSAVVAWPDGHVAARGRTQLLTEDHILAVWPP